MNYQKTFDYVLAFMREQKAPSAKVKGSPNQHWSTEVTCLYRGPAGGKCAVGCLLPDSVYERRMEGKSVAFLLRNPAVRAALGIKGDTGYTAELTFLRDLQRAHDDAANTSAHADMEWLPLFEQRMRSVACGYNLTYGRK